MSHAGDNVACITKAALLTPPTPSAIATIAICGPLAEKVVSASFRLATGHFKELNVDDARYGLWAFTSGDVPPEHVVLCRTDEDDFEVHCHGGPAVCKLILEDLRRGGCRIDSSNPATVEMPLTIEAAATAALPFAATLKVAAVLLDQVHGSLTLELEHLLKLIESGRNGEAESCCARVLDRSVLGLRLCKPWRLTLAGPPNAGKSSLINALVGASRVLVHHEPGTTRDAVDTPIVVSSWPIVITDTAGLRDTQESIEQMGIDTAWRRWQEADIGLLVVDASVGWTAVHDALIAQRGPVTAIVSNKQDLQRCDNIPQAARASISGLNSASGPVHVLPTRATQPGGTDTLLSALGDHFDRLLPPAGSGVPFLPAHVANLEQVKTCLEESRLEAAAGHLREWLG